MKRIDIICVFSIIFMLSLLIAAQGSTTLTSSSPKVIRKNGWRIPGRDDMSTLVRTEPIEIDGVKVNKRILRTYSENEPLTVVDFFSTDADGNITINSALCTVRSLIAYEANGKTFAYQVALIATNASENGVRQNTGAGLGFTYLDETGEGNFQTRYASGSVLRVPEWVKDR